MERLTFDLPTMPAVFVLSPPRSGSTLLRYILDSHSRIASPGENVPARLRYEDMVRDPPAALSPLFEFLGVGWEPQAIERALTAPHDEGGGDLYIRYTRSIDPSGIGKGASIPFSRIEPALAPMNALLAR